MVDDGICDCCDGSDEGSTSCPNTCLAEGKAERDIIIAEADKHVTGAVLKNEWIAQSSISKREVAATHVKLQAKVDPLKEIVEELDARKTVAEMRENVEIERRKLETERKECEIYSAVITAVQIISDPNATMPEGWNTETDGAWEAPKIHNPEYTSQCKEFKEEVAKVEAEAKAKVDKAAADQASATATAATDATAEKPAEESLNANERHALAAEPAKIEEINANERHALPAASLIPDDTVPPPPPPPPPPPVEKYEDEEAKAIRAEHTTKKADLTKAEKEANEVKDILDQDYGPDDAFYKLRESCVELQLNQYKYTVCPFKDVKQDGTLLGKWNSWAEPHNVMHFKDGQNCWNIGTAALPPPLDV